MQTTSRTDSPAVLILGAGVNGCSLARELILNGVPVVLVDQHDIATGATAKSSRLIHGGLRYLEYGDFGLVRESLRERKRLLELAPQFVSPLRLFIPVRRRFGGLVQSAIRFLKLTRLAAGMQRVAPSFGTQERGLWTVRLGLKMYDWIAAHPALPPSSVHPVGDGTGPTVDPQQYSWLCSYSDAQMLYPERFVLAILDDARAAAAAQGIDFRVLTYHRVELNGSTATVRPVDAAIDPATAAADVTPFTFRPATIVNATGAWGDLTLGELHIPSPRLFGGTKGSHIVTRQPRLRDSLGGQAIYAEAADGRLVFILPFGSAVLIGTTDERFEGRPEEAVATSAEVEYLLAMVNEVLPQAAIQRSDVDSHYCGVRPLPYVPAGRTAAISRDHAIETVTHQGIAIDTLVGGKLTTCRAFAELAADRILERLGVPRTVSTQERVVPGGEDWPPTPEALAAMQERLARETGRAGTQVQYGWTLLGSRAEAVYRALPPDSPGVVPGTDIPAALVDWIIDQEWVTRVEDLAERRLLLAWHPKLSIEMLEFLAGRLVAKGRISATAAGPQVVAAAERLMLLYGCKIRS